MVKYDKNLLQYFFICLLLPGKNPADALVTIPIDIAAIVFFGEKDPLCCHSLDYSFVSGV